MVTSKAISRQRAEEEDDTNSDLGRQPEDVRKTKESPEFRRLFACIE
jgi:hypothetical protein